MSSASGPSRSPAPKGEQPEKKRCFRPSSIIAACFLLTAALALAYVAGVMSGRAYYGGQARTVAGVGSGRASAGTSSAGSNGESTWEEVFVPSAEVLQEGAGQGGRILAAEELRYAGALRGVPGDRPAAENPHPAPNAKAPSAAENASAQPARTPMQPAVAEGQTPPPAPRPATGALFDYVFQVGAFKDEDTVDGLRQRLEGRGLRTRMQRDGKLLVVFVLLRGDESRAAEVVRTLEELRLGAPLLRSKKPVTS